MLDGRWEPVALSPVLGPLPMMLAREASRRERARKCHRAGGGDGRLPYVPATCFALIFSAASSLARWVSVPLLLFLVCRAVHHETSAMWAATSNNRLGKGRHMRLDSLLRTF